ncbi:MAG: cyclic dehypoxanthinyl futalosine synthase, partial [Candidatus Zipacnadales bacterium]
MRRLTAPELLDLFAETDLLALGQAADAARQELHPQNIVTYVIDRNVNYTNVCVSGCQFCAYFRPPGHAEAFVLPLEKLRQKLTEAQELGATQVLLQGGLHPDLGLDFYCAMLRVVKEVGLRAHCFSPPEIVHLARLEGLSIRECLTRLQAAGLDTIPGGGAEVLSDEVRSRVSPRKCTKAEWLEIMRQAHRLGLQSTATLMFGMGEEPRHLVEHLLAVRELQDETGGFTAFIPWTFQQTHTALEGSVPPLGGHAYLKMLAICRLALDNIANLQASWVTQGGKIAQLALRFGANDMGSTMIEENVVLAAGFT